ncbi:MAG: ATP phosphoribosyltransferase regulatory subunit [Clostridia bacterium]|nr:ATP phosphoribosyltransferase regulatory subunit [Clostridia bacterium]
MLISKLHTPEGVKDYLPLECALKKKIEDSVAGVFNNYGYLPVTSPTFEYNDVFCGMGGVKDNRVFKFLDKDGSLLVLRPDMTPAIARIAATAYSKKDLPLKFCYIEGMFRTNENYQGKLREFTQAGIEFLGINSIEADAEVVSVAINSLLEVGIRNFKIDLGHALFLKGVIEESNVSDDIAAEIQKNIIKKNYVAVNELAENISNENIKYILQELPLLIGDLSIIDNVKNKVSNEKSIKSINYLSELYSILKEMGFEKYVSFDLGVIGSMDYYTGLIFRGYAKGSGASILDGGRYDNMVEKFGANMPAVGFALKVNELMKTMDLSEADSNKYLIVYDKADRINAFKTADILRKNNISAECSFLGENIDVNREYALNKNINNILKTDNNKLTLLNLKDNSEIDITVDCLITKEAK